MPAPVEKVSDTEDLSNNIAYTTIISAGTLKGKSPAGALLENPKTHTVEKVYLDLRYDASVQTDDQAFLY